MALVPLRQFVLPRFFARAHLSQLDAAEYEEAPPVPDKLRAAQVGSRRRGAAASLATVPAASAPWSSLSLQLFLNSSR
jgi:hypothetical protein